MIPTPKIVKRMTTKHCAWLGCENSFEGSQFEKYCHDPRCVELRTKSYKRTRVTKDPSVENRILNKSFKRKLKTGRVLLARCGAKNSKGIKCPKTFKIIFDSRREVYPKFCEEHRNAYRRTIFMKG